MPEWGSDTHVEIYGCSSPRANGVSGGLRRLRRRADGDANSAGDACGCGYTGCAADSGTYTCANPGVDTCAYTGTHTKAHPCAYTDGDTETHANGDACAYANGDAGTDARTYGGEQRP